MPLPADGVGDAGRYTHVCASLIAGGVGDEADARAREQCGHEARVPASREIGPRARRSHRIRRAVGLCGDAQAVLDSIVEVERGDALIDVRRPIGLTPSAVRGDRDAGPGIKALDALPVGQRSEVKAGAQEYVYADRARTGSQVRRECERRGREVDAPTTLGDEQRAHPEWVVGDLKLAATAVISRPYELAVELLDIGSAAFLEIGRAHV